MYSMWAFVITLLSVVVCCRVINHSHSNKKTRWKFTKLCINLPYMVFYQMFLFKLSHLVKKGPVREGELVYVGSWKENVACIIYDHESTSKWTHLSDILLPWPYLQFIYTIISFSHIYTTAGQVKGMKDAVAKGLFKKDVLYVLLSGYLLIF